MVLKNLPTTLDRVDVGARVRVGAPQRLDATLVRLGELGIAPGTVVTVVRKAPWGDPIEVSVRGTRVCLRKADAAAFPVEHAGDVDGGGP